MTTPLRYGTTWTARLGVRTRSADCHDLVVSANDMIGKEDCGRGRGQARGVL